MRPRHPPAWGHASFHWSSQTFRMLLYPKMPPHTPTSLDVAPVTSRYRPNQRSPILQFMRTHISKQSIYTLLFLRKELTLDREPNFRHICATWSSKSGARKTLFWKPFWGAALSLEARGELIRMLVYTGQAKQGVWKLSLQHFPFSICWCCSMSMSLTQRLLGKLPASPD